MSLLSLEKKRNFYQGDCDIDCCQIDLPACLPARARPPGSHVVCCTHQVWTGSPFPLTFMGNPGDGEKSYPIAKNLLISPIRKIPLNRFKSFAVKSFIFSPSNSNFQVIILCNLHLQLQSFLLYHVLNLCPHISC